MSSGNIVLRTEKLRMEFGGLVALNNVDFYLEENSIVSIIGPNGSGKTTFFNMITGVYHPISGHIFFGKEQTDIVGKKPHQIAHLGISRTFQGIRLFSNMTVIENVMVGQHSRSITGFLLSVLHTKSKRDEEESIRRKSVEILKMFREDIVCKANMLAKNLPYADRRRLEIARALATEPEILLLDEPSAGMNPREASELMDDIKHIRDMGYSIVVIEHDMKVVQSLSDRVVVLHYGKKIADGKFDEIRQSEQVIEAYLGKKKR